MKPLRPFWSYYGAKWTLAPRYPAPAYPDVFEPFAGSACYSLLYPDRAITLCDADPVVAGIWKFLIRVKESEILSLPDRVDHVDELGKAPEEARWLVGFWLARARQHPAQRSSSWKRSNEGNGRFWGPKARLRIASQLNYVRHWKIIEGDYRELPNNIATRFVDPPYQGEKGRRYRCGSKWFDYSALGAWCKDRAGQTIVCEAAGADWLPFADFYDNPAVSKKRSVEMLWTQDNGPV
jgi:hypothetical protein